MTPLIEQLLTTYEIGKIDRRQLLQGLTAVVAAAAATPVRAAAAAPLTIKTVNHIGIASPKVNETRDFYQKLFGLKADTIDDNDRVYLRLPGGTFISINKAGADGKASYSHICLGVDGFDAKNPKATNDRLLAAGFKAGGGDSASAGVLDPNGLMIQLSAVTYNGMEDHPLKK